MDFNLTRTEFNQALLQFIQVSESWYLSKGELPWQLCNVNKSNPSSSQFNSKSLATTTKFKLKECSGSYQDTALLYAKRTWIQPSSTPSSSTLYNENQTFSSSLTLNNQTEQQEVMAPSFLSLNRFEVHIVYHSIYEVPVIYFQVTPHPFSIPLTQVNEVQSSLALPSVQIIQQIHPHLSLPFWLIHPCQTRSLLLPLLSFVSNHPYAWFYTWLSMFGQVFGGLIPFSLYNFLEKTNVSFTTKLKESEFLTPTHLLQSKQKEHEKN